MLATPSYKKFKGPKMTQKIQYMHLFPDTSSARDSRELGDAVNQGDVLVVESESVVGVCTSFPFAVTQDRGNLSEFCFDQLTYEPADLLDIVQGIYTAVAEAQRRGYEINPKFERYMTATSSPGAPADAGTKGNAADILAAAIKKHRQSAAGYAALGTPMTADACAEAIARTYARFADVDEDVFLAGCGIEPAPAS